MKRIYIKPEMEELVCDNEQFLCASDYDWGIDNAGGKGSGQPAPNGARTEDPFFDDEEEEY